MRVGTSDSVVERPYSDSVDVPVSIQENNP